MTRTLLTSIVLCFASAFVSAQTLSIQSGEHATFSRVAVPLPSDASWSVSTEPGVVRLEVPGADFNTSRLFDLMPRSRIVEARAEPGVLTLELNCDCPSEAFLFQDRFVVIDIADGGPLVLDSEGTPSAPDNIPPTEFAGEAAPQPPRSRPARVPGSLQLPLSPQLSENLPVVVVPEQVARADDTQNEPSPPAQPSFPALERDIVSGVADALTQGFLDPAPRRAPQPPKTEGEEATTPDAEKPAPVEEKDSDIANRLAENDAIKITGPDDRRIEAPNAPEDTRNFDGIACIPDSQFAAMSPDDESNFLEELAKHRSALFGERDRLNPDAAKKLVSHLLAYGFGVEARRLLSDLDVKDPNRVLTSISYIVDDGSDPDPLGAAAQLSCDGASALWAAMALPELPPDANLNTDAVVRYFETLSLTLRTHLGPTLSERLASAGETQAAAQINRSLLRVLETLPASQLFAQAMIFKKKNRLEEADSVLSDLIAELTDTGATAIIELVEVRLERGLPMSVEEADLIAGRAYTDRTAGNAAELKRASIKAFAMAGRFDLATQALNTGDEDAATTLWLGGRVAEHTDVEGFLGYVFEGPEGSGSVIPHPEILQRLYELGFEEKATKLGYSLPSDETAMPESNVSVPPMAEFSDVDVGIPGAAADRLRLSEAILEGTDELKVQLEAALADSDFEGLLTN